MDKKEQNATIKIIDWWIDWWTEEGNKNYFCAIIQINENELKLIKRDLEL